MNRYNSFDGTSYCLGMSLTIEALKHKANYVREVLLSSKASKNNQLDLLLELCKENTIRYVYDDRGIDKLSNKENCYCIGIFDKFHTSFETNNHILLYGFKDYGDLGTTIRSSISFNFKDIAIIDSTIDYFDPRCVRASMGSIFLANIRVFKDLEEYCGEYKNNLYPFTSNGNKDLEEIELKEPFSVVIPENYYSLDSLYPVSYSIEHSKLEDISLSIRSSVILSEVYYRTVNGKNISNTAHK